MKTTLLKAAFSLLLSAGAITSLQAQVIDKTPLFHMSFDNVNGTNVINDGTGGAVMNGSMFGNAAIVPGKFGNGLSIFGSSASDASVRIANAIIPLNTQAGQPAWSVVMWFQTTTPGGCFAYQGSGAWVGGNSDFYLTGGRNGGASAGNHAGAVRNGQEWEEGSTDVNDGLWHHFVLTFDGTTKTMYLDGATNTFDENSWAGAGVGNSFWIGGNPYNGDGSTCLNGLIDEVYLFNRALTFSDVKALNDSNTVPVVPVTVVVAPTSGYRGQVIRYTATATPAATFTVTNARVDLSGLALSATASLVLSNNNVFTNTFTVPANSPIGIATLKATVIDNEPLIGSASVPFTVIPRPPTNATVLGQITGPTNFYTYTEASYNFNATNDSPDNFFAMNYAWYKNGVLVSTNPMGANYTFLTTPNDNGATIQCIANIADTNFSNLSVTSAVITMVAQPGALVYTNGLKREFFAGATRVNAEIGNVAKGKPINSTPNANFAGGQGDNYTERYSGYFIPPTNGNYVLFLAADDDTDVYLSTDSSPLNKRLVAQEYGYSGTGNWNAAGGNGSISTQKRSDQFTNNVGATPYAAGFPLIGGQLYYLESVHHNGTGGDNWGVTYSTIEDINSTGGIPDGTPSLLAGASNNLAFITWPGTNIVWTQTIANKSVFEGDTATFFAIAVSDAEMVPVYTWYVNGVAAQSSANGTNFALPSVTLAQNGAQVTVVASTLSVSITNGPVTLTVNRAVFEPGWAKEEKWTNLTSRTPLENGTAPVPTFTIGMPGFIQGSNSPTGQGDFAMRMSGFFVAPTSGDYIFYVSSDDDSDLFLSTDDTSVNKRLIAQEAGWNNPFAWNTAGGGGSVASQMRSDQFIPTGATTAPFAAGITLQAGHKYYMEVDHHNGAAGGTHMGVSYRLTSEADLFDGVAPKAVGTNIGFNVVRSTNVGFVLQPISVVSQIGGYVTFTALGTNDSALPAARVNTGNEGTSTNNFTLYQWFENGVAITNLPTATASNLTFGPIEAKDANAVITCQIRGLGYADASFNPIWSNSLPATITLSTSQQVFEPGYVQHDMWTNQTARTTIENGSQNRAPRLTYATIAFAGPINNTAPNNYVQRISSYFTPSTDGAYAFVVASDDDSDLFVSTDSSRNNMRLVAQEGGWSNPFNWTTAGNGTSSQKNSSSWVQPNSGNSVPWSSGISLVHGQKYYMELVHHNGGGGNNAEVTYYNMNTDQPAVNGDNTRLTNNVIGIYVPRVASMGFTAQPASQSVTSGGNSITFTAFATSSIPAMQVGTTNDFQPLLANPTNPATTLIFQWYKNGSPIPGATSSNYTQTPILPSDNNAQFVCAIRVLGYSDNSLTPIFSNSLPAVLTVTTETDPPLISYVATFQNTNQDPARIIVDVTFNEWMDTTTANNIFNYSVAGASVLSANLASNHRTVELVLNQMPTLPLNITINNVKDLSGNTIAANSTAPINPVLLTFTDVGTTGSAAFFGQPGINPAYPSSIWIEATNGFLVSAQGSDISGVSDGFNFGWEFKTNDFDVVVRGVSIGHTSNFAKAGLMVREDLTPGSRNWAVVNEPLSADGISAPDGSGAGANNIEATMRATNSVGTVSWKTNTSTTIPRYPNAWVRIKRTGNLLVSYASSNAVDWVTLGAYDTTTNVNGALPSVVYVGICTTAHNNDSASAVPPPPPFKYYNTADYADYSSSFVFVPKSTLSSSRSGTNIVISWTPAGGHLEGSAVIGAGASWQNLGTVNPATIPMGSSNQYFRVVNP